MTVKVLKNLVPDSKGRITLGSLAKGVSSYSVRQLNDQIILEPNIEIPRREKWLWENKAALQQVKQGLEDSAAKRVRSKGDFTQFTDNDDK